MMTYGMGWVGVDLDGTLAHYDEWRGVEHIGKPIMPMVQRVQHWLSEGQDVRIFTARFDYAAARPHIEEWCQEHIGAVLPITNVKDMHCSVIWDDRAMRVMSNTGEPCCSGERHGVSKAEHGQPGAARGGDVKADDGAGRGCSGPCDEGRGDSRKAPSRRRSRAPLGRPETAEGAGDGGAGPDQANESDAASSGG